MHLVPWCRILVVPYPTTHFRSNRIPAVRLLSMSAGSNCGSFDWEYDELITT